MVNTIIRATILEEELIEQYENHLYDTDKTEREVIREALEIYLNESD